LCSTKRTCAAQKKTVWHKKCAAQMLCSTNHNLCSTKFELCGTKSACAAQIFRLCSTNFVPICGLFCAVHVSCFTCLTLCHCSCTSLYMLHMCHFVSYLTCFASSHTSILALSHCLHISLCLALHASHLVSRFTCII